MKIDFAIRSKRVLLPDGTKEAIVLIANEKIADVLFNLNYDIDCFIYGWIY